MGRDPNQAACILDKKNATWSVSLPTGCFFFKKRAVGRFQNSGPPHFCLQKKSYGQRAQPGSMFFAQNHATWLGSLPYRVVFLKKKGGGPSQLKSAQT